MTYYKGCLILLCIILVSCTNEDNVLRYGTESEKLRDFVANAPIFTVDLGENQPTEITVDTKDIWGKSRESNNAYRISGISSTTYFNNFLYVTDPFRKTTIFKISNDGYVVDLIGKQGRGPGEFIAVLELFSNSSNLFSADFGQQKLHIYNSNLKRDTSFVSLFKLGGQLGASDKYLFLPTGNQKSNLIKAHELSSGISDEAETFLPKLISLGMNPSAYNSFLVDGNGQHIIAAYPGLPLIFIFDNSFKLLRTLQFTSEEFKNYDNPPLQEVASQTSMPVKRYLNDILITDNGTLLLSTNSTLYVLKLVNKNYQVVERNRFYKSHNHKQINFLDLSYNNSTVFLSTMRDSLAYSYKFK